MFRRRCSLPIWLPVVGLVGALAAAPAAAEFCLGPGCGIGKPGYTCHSVDAAGVECWSPDGDCELAPGFSRGRDGAGPCALVLDAFPGSGLAEVLGGRRVLHGRAPGAPAPGQAPAPAPPGADDPAAADEQGGGPSAEVTTTLEREVWSTSLERGDAWGLAVGWLRETESGRRFGVDLSARRATPDTQESRDLVHLALGYGQRLAPISRVPGLQAWWGVDLTGTTFEEAGDTGLEPRRFLGGSAHLAAARDFASGHRLVGVAVLEGATGHDLGRDLTSLGLGAAYDLPIGQRLLLELELFDVRVLTPELDDDHFTQVAGLVTWFVSPRFALTLGYRILEGVPGVESSTVTLGSSRRIE